MIENLIFVCGFIALFILSWISWEFRKKYKFNYFLLGINFTIFIIMVFTVIYPEKSPLHSFYIYLISEHKSWFLPIIRVFFGAMIIALGISVPFVFFPHKREDLEFSARLGRWVYYVIFIIGSIGMIYLGIAISINKIKLEKSDYIMEDSIQRRNYKIDIQKDNIADFEKKYKPGWVWKPAVIAVTDINLRSMPNSKSKIIGIIHKGDRLAFLGNIKKNVNNFYLIESKNQLRGWVSGKYLRFENINEQLSSGSIFLSMALKYVFPEPTFLKKILGVFFGIVISLLSRFIFRKFSKWVSWISFSLTLIYFVLKHNIAMTEADIYIFCLAVLFLTVTIKFLTDWLYSQIERLFYAKLDRFDRRRFI